MNVNEKMDLDSSAKSIDSSTRAIGCSTSAILDTGQIQSDKMEDCDEITDSRESCGVTSKKTFNFQKGKLEGKKLTGRAYKKRTKIRNGYQKVLRTKQVIFQSYLTKKSMKTR